MKSPYFPFFLRDWLCSRRVLSMSGAAVKAYLYLLCESWLQEPRATLPNDRDELASMSRLDRDSFANLSAEIMVHFKMGECEVHKGRLYNELLLEISSKWEKNQRHNNKNAKRTRNKRAVNARLDNENDIGIHGSEGKGMQGKGGRKDSDPEFVRWYSIYPRKQDKAGAEKAWKNVQDKAGTADKIIVSLSWQTKSHGWTKDGGVFVPLPSTYINRRRWEDEKPADVACGGGATPPVAPSPIYHRKYVPPPKPEDDDGKDQKVVWPTVVKQADAAAPRIDAAVQGGGEAGEDL